MFALIVFFVVALQLQVALGQSYPVVVHFTAPTGGIWSPTITPDVYLFPASLGAFQPNTFSASFPGAPATLESVSSASSAAYWSVSFNFSGTQIGFIIVQDTTPTTARVQTNNVYLNMPTTGLVAGVTTNFYVTQCVTPATGNANCAQAGTVDTRVQTAPVFTLNHYFALPSISSWSTPDLVAGYAYNKGANTGSVPNFNPFPGQAATFFSGGTGSQPYWYFFSFTVSYVTTQVGFIFSNNNHTSNAEFAQTVDLFETIPVVANPVSTTFNFYYYNCSLSLGTGSKVGCVQSLTDPGIIPPTAAPTSPAPTSSSAPAPSSTSFPTSTAAPTSTSAPASTSAPTSTSAPASTSTSTSAPTSTAAPTSATTSAPTKPTAATTPAKTNPPSVSSSSFVPTSPSIASSSTGPNSVWSTASSMRSNGVHVAVLVAVVGAFAAFWRQ